MRLLSGFDPSTLSDYHYDEQAADNAVEFIESFCCHVRGELAGRPLLLEQWQKDIVKTFYGWKDSQGYRRFSEAFITVARKNGKSLLLAAILTYELFCSGEQGNELISAANSRDQASIVFDLVAGIIRNNQLLNKRCKILDTTKRVVVPATNSVYRAIAAEASTAHGLNLGAVCFDELHESKNRDLYDTLKTSQGARRQPIFISITTAGYNKESLCYKVQAHAERVRDNPETDPTFLPVIYSMPEDDDWQQESNWSKANPNLNVSVPVSFLCKEVERAKESPAYESSVRRLYLNQWTESHSAFFNMEHYDQCKGSVEFDESPCFGGLDLSSTTDLSAFVLVQPKPDGVYAVKCWCWIPSDNAHQREKRDKVAYRAWQRMGAIEFTDGNVIDYEVIRNKINELAHEYNIKEIAVDRWNSRQLSQQLAGDGVEMVEFGQGYRDMSDPTKHLEKLVLSEKLLHDGNPVLRWCATNTMIELDAAGNIKPSKRASTEKIDLIVALVMALGRAVLIEEQITYNERGILRL